MFHLSPIGLRHAGITLCCATASLVFSAVVRGADVLRIDEWGTFTALQNDRGDGLPGINVDDEPLPEFCHNLYPWAVLHSLHGTRYWQMQGAPPRHPYVSLRLETPVIYFHPPADEKLPFSMDVEVQFHGGWLTEFYPHARPDAPGLLRNEFNFGPITPDTVGTLTWKHAMVGPGGVPPATTEHVWLAPRNVAAVDVTVGQQTEKDSSSESERFLFYRGVGNRAAPLRVIRDHVKGTLTIKAQCADCLAAGQSARVAGLWLVHTRRDGAVAFRALGPVTATRDAAATLLDTPGTFADTDFSSSNLDHLRAALHKALVADGLYPDEAAAMLETWKRAYFKSPGMRLFFLVPRIWTDAILPLKFSRAAEVHRVMMGRIELFGPEQRELLKTLAALPVSDRNWINTIPDSPNAGKFRQGRSDFGDLGVKIPPDYQAYLDLGRFRNPMVLAEQHARPSQRLSEFIQAYGLEAFEPDK